MLLEFVYLEERILADFVAQVDGGLIVETKSRRSKKGGLGVNLGVKWLSAKGETAREQEQLQTVKDVPSAQFQRLLYHAYNDPEVIAWTDVMDPETDFESAQVGETISWECDVDIPNVSRLVAKDGSGAQLIELFDAALEGVADAGLKIGDLDGGALAAGQLAQLQGLRMQAAIVKRLIDRLNAKRSVVGADPDTNWKVFGRIDGDHLHVDDIDAERLIIVGKVKRVIPPGESRQIVDVARLQELSGRLNQQQQGAGQPPQPGFEEQTVEGPALELTILAIYR
jgi:hypothetical protein